MLDAEEGHKVGLEQAQDAGPDVAVEADRVGQ